MQRQAEIDQFWDISQHPKTRKFTLIFYLKHNLKFPEFFSKEFIFDVKQIELQYRIA